MKKLLLILLCLPFLFSCGDSKKNIEEGKVEYNLGELNLDDVEEELILITRPPPPVDPGEEQSWDDFVAEAEAAEEEVFMVVETMPEFKCMKFGKKEYCGDKGFNKYIQKNVKYPIKAKENNITGKVWVQFIVDKTGSVTNVRVIRGVEKT